MAVTTEPKLDAHRLRTDFAVFDELVNGKPVAYLDSAASTQKPRQVLDTMRDFYEHSYANVHRGVYRLAERATTGYETARRKVAELVNAPSEREVIFTRSATEALNLVAYAWGLDNLGARRRRGRHRSRAPLELRPVAVRRGANRGGLPCDPDRRVRRAATRRAGRDRARGNVKVVASNLVSNTLGTVNPVNELASGPTSAARSWSSTQRRRRRTGTSTCRRSDCEFLSISSHKMCGPSGIGALWGRRELLEEMAPFNLGGEMIRSVSMERTTWNELPYKFEAGTPAIAEAVGFGAAVDYVTAVGLDAIERHEHELVEYALGRLGELPWISTYGPSPEHRAGIVSLNVDGVHPHDVAQVLDWEGVAVRAGHHCTQPLMAKLGIAATVRASFYLYSIPEEIDRLVDGLQKAKSSLG